MAGPGARYDRIGVGYTTNRRPDPRIAARVEVALGDAPSVVNVGAGAGSYESARTAVAVEPSRVMLAQRPAGTAPAVQAQAEHLPFGDGAFGAATAFMTVHHWADPAAGLAELRRVSRRQVVFCFEPGAHDALWVVREYFPELVDTIPATARPSTVAALLGGGRIETLPVPADCTDGFASAYWRRPERYLEQSVRDNSSVFAQLSPGAEAAGVARLAADLENGHWAEVHAELLALEEIDAGLRLVVAG